MNENLRKLLEVRAEISRVNTTAGQTIFNPAATGLLEEVMDSLGKPVPQNHLFLIACVAGGRGWGETGQVGYEVVSAATEDEARAAVKKSTPGGWKIHYMGTTTRLPGMNPNFFGAIKTGNMGLGPDSPGHVPHR